MGMPSGWELLLVVGIIVLLFGGKKIPELAKGLGKGIKDFKKAVNEDDEPAQVKEIKSKPDDELTSKENKQSQNA